MFTTGVCVELNGNASNSLVPTKAVLIHIIIIILVITTTRILIYITLLSNRVLIIVEKLF